MRDIQYKSIACGPDGQFQPGDKRHNVPDAEAEALVSGGYAVDITPVREQATPPAVEHAVSQAQPRRGRRGGR